MEIAKPLSVTVYLQNTINDRCGHGDAGVLQSRHGWLWVVRCWTTGYIGLCGVS